MKMADLSDMLKKAFKSVCVLTSWYLLNQQIHGDIQMEYSFD